MRKYPYLAPLLVLGLLLVILFLPVTAAQPAPASTLPEEAAFKALPRPVIQTFDGYKCRLLFEKTADRMGWVDPEIYVNEYEDSLTCQMTILDLSGVPIQYFVSLSYSIAAQSWCDDCDYYCNTPGNSNDCTCVDIHGMLGRQGSMIPAGTSLEFCDKSCSLTFQIQTASDDNTFIDPQPLADALYYSALELNCCQAVEAVPPQDIPPLPEDPLPPAAEDPIPFVPGDIPLPGDSDIPSPNDSNSLAKNPVVPLSGALIGTIAGWLISVVVSNWNALKGLLSPTVGPPPAPSDVPTAGGELPTWLPGTWTEWENRYVQGEPPEPLDEPDKDVLRSIHVSLEYARQRVLNYYTGEVTPEGQGRVQHSTLTMLDEQEFVTQYKQVFGEKDPDSAAASAFVDPNTGRMTICRGRAINYTPVHEVLHAASNPDFRRLTNETFDEAVTEYFALKIAHQDKVPRMTEYQLNGSTAIIDQIVAAHGESVLRKAYFQPGEQGYNELQQAVDKKLGPGAFKKALEIMARKKTEADLAVDPTNEKQKALDLLRSRGIRQ